MKARPKRRAASGGDEAEDGGRRGLPWFALAATTLLLQAACGGAADPAPDPCAPSAEAQAEAPFGTPNVVGTGTPASCSGAAFVAAVARGGFITFDCGPDPVTIQLTSTAKVFNDRGPKVVIDGGGKVTLSGGGRVRILYQNTCDPAQVWTTPHCQDQDHPRLTVQHLAFEDGDATGETMEGGGGGAVFVRGGRLKIVDCRFRRNRCDATGPDLGGAAVRALSQSGGLPIHVVGSTFGGAAGLGNVCSNGGGLSGIGVSWRVADSVFTHNQAIGAGANPARPGTPGGGSGGAIYMDGNLMSLSLCRTRIEDNTAAEGGGAVFFVSNDLTGTMAIGASTLRHNTSGRFETAGYPGIFFLGSGAPVVAGSTLAP